MTETFKSLFDIYPDTLCEGAVVGYTKVDGSRLKFPCNIDTDDIVKDAKGRWTASSLGLKPITVGSQENLNLTKANHVIHFDRWWNPAVENQATDRAYRIGQKNDVLVHKLVCKGTIEEKIDEMIESKKELALNVIGGGGESWITEMSNEELLSIFKLD